MQRVVSRVPRWAPSSLCAVARTQRFYSTAEAAAPTTPEQAQTPAEPATQTSSPATSTAPAARAKTSYTAAKARPPPTPLKKAAASTVATSSAAPLPVYKAKTIADGTAVKDEVNRHALDIDWMTSFHGISTKPVTKGQFEVLMKPLDEADIEVKPDGVVYLPEIKYRRILNEAFGPMGWGLIPRGEAVVGSNIVTREYALVVDGR